MLATNKFEFEFEFEFEFGCFTRYLFYLTTSTMGRGNSVDYAPNTLLSVIGLMKGKQLNRQPKQ